MEPLTSPTPTEAQLQERLAALTAQLAAERQARIVRTVNDLVQEGRLTPLEAPKAIARALADETYLPELLMRPPLSTAPGGVARAPR